MYVRLVRKASSPRTGNTNTCSTVTSITHGAEGDTRSDVGQEERRFGFWSMLHTCKYKLGKIPPYLLFGQPDDAFLFYTHPSSI
jgi:hypothetical protein